MSHHVTTIAGHISSTKMKFRKQNQTVFTRCYQTEACTVVVLRCLGKVGKETGKEWGEKVRMRLSDRSCP
jgi:surface antigen